MVKHIIIWNLKPEITGDEKIAVMNGAKTALEALAGKIEGLTDIHVYTASELLPSSTGDMMLDTTFTDEASYAVYRTHPEHVAAADKFVRPFISGRHCCDFQI